MRTALGGLVLVFALAATTHAAWEGNQCVKCHEAEVRPISLGHTFADWRGSSHAGGGVAREKIRLYRVKHSLEELTTLDPSWHAGALERFHNLERDYRAVQLRWHTFATREVAADSRDLIKLAEGPLDEAGVMARRSRAK